MQDDNILPKNRNPDLVARLVFKQEELILPAKPIQIPGDPDILNAIVSDFFYLTLLPPFKGRKPIRTFFAAKGLLGKVIQGKPIAQYFMDLHEQIQGRQTIKIKGRQPGQYLIIKGDYIKANHQIQQLQVVTQRLDILLVEGMKII